MRRKLSFIWSRMTAPLWLQCGHGDSLRLMSSGAEGSVATGCYSFLIMYKKPRVYLGSQLVVWPVKSLHTQCPSEVLSDWVMS